MSRRFLIFLWTFFFASCAQAAELTTLIYHDVLPDPGQDPYNVSRAMFVAQMDYLKQNGYQPVNLDFLEKVRRGKSSLPAKAVLLTFDDALRSYSEFVVPTLKAYGYPSVVSVVTAWASGEDVPAEYRDRLMSWVDLQKLQKSPLVEIISHSHDLHRGILSNPQANEYAAGVTRRYSNITHTYESEIEFRQRIRQDFKFSMAKMKQYLRMIPRAIAWPYGAYDQVLVEEMSRVGIQFYFTMENGPTPPEQFPKIKRTVVRNAASIASFIDDIQYRYRLFDQRIVEFSLDPFVGISVVQQNELLSRLLNRLAAIRANAVILSPFTADRRQAFFYNRQMPVAADILNRTLHQIRTRLHIQKIYLQLPAVLEDIDQTLLYTDLARLNWFNGVIFDASSDSTMESRIKRIVGYYRPETQFGSEKLQSDKNLYDFSLVRLDAGLARPELEMQVQTVNKIPSTVFVILKRASTEEGYELAARLRILHGLGTKHFGYGLDDYTAGLPAAYLVAAEMSVKESGEKHP